MILELIKAAALLLALSLLYGLIVRFWQNYKLIQQLMAGLLFGGICVVGMMLPIEVHPGVIFDPRSVVLSMAGLFGGPVVAAVSAVIAGGYRLWIGGGGVYVGVAVVISCSLLGLTYRHAQHKGWVKVGLLQLLVFGFLVHAVEILLFTALPADVVETVMKTVALPLILTFTPATAFLGLLLKDIDTRFKTEAALLESENRLTSHLQNTPLAAISFDDKFHYTGWNKAATELFGYTADEVLGKHAMELLVPDHIHTDINKTFKLLLDQEGGFRGINENKTRDGRTIICQWYNTPIIDKSGKTLGVDSLAEDITALMQAQDEIKLKNTLLVTQQEASIDGIFALDEAGKIISINQRFIDLWQIPSVIVESNSRDNILQSLSEKVVDTKLFMDRMYDSDEHRNDSSDDEVILKDGRIVESTLR